MCERDCVHRFIFLSCSLRVLFLSLFFVGYRSSAHTEFAIPKRFGDWNGTEPLELLHSAQASHDGQAVGRFAHLAAASAQTKKGSMSSSSDPLSELHAVSTESLIDRTREKQRLETGKKVGRHAATLEKRVEGATSSASSSLVAIAMNQTGGNGNSRSMLVDHSAAVKRNRKRARDEELGAKGDCPRLQRVAWKWTGNTTAAASCWLNNDESIEEDIAGNNNTVKNLPLTKFKCGVVMEGTNVFEGLRAMVTAGLAQAPLPDFVREAPTLGSSTITVDHGEFGGTDAFAAV